jgi:hypothetical protein
MARPNVHGKPSEIEPGCREESARLPLETDRPDIVMREDLAAGGPTPATTQVADGLARRAWTVDEVERMVEVESCASPSRSS